VIAAEVSDLLRYAATLDRWLKQSDPEAGQLMVAGWTDMLAAVPYAVAREAVQRHYSVHQERTIQPGDLLDAYRETLRAKTAEEVLQQTAELNAAAPGPRQGMGLWMRDVLAAVRAGLPAESVPIPAGTSVTPAQDAWQRRCAFPNICACSHTECRAGWLDQPATVVNSLGRSYEAAKRCPVCTDGILMAQERGIARKPRQHSGRLR
jgi:hypothetical protein